MGWPCTLLLAMGQAGNHQSQRWLHKPLGQAVVYCDYLQHIVPRPQGGGTRWKRLADAQLIVVLMLTQS